MLTSQDSVDRTLEIVKDADKFKERIAELKKAVTAYNTAATKSKKTVVAANKELDNIVAQSQELRENAKKDVQRYYDDAAKAMEPVKVAQGEVDKSAAAVGRRVTRLEQDRAALNRSKEQLKEDRMAFEKMRLQFEELTKAACALV